MPAPSLFDDRCLYHVHLRAPGAAVWFPDGTAVDRWWRCYRREADPVVNTFAYCILPEAVHLVVRVRPSSERPRTHRRMSVEAALRRLVRLYARWTGLPDPEAAILQRRRVRTPFCRNQLVRHLHHAPVRRRLVVAPAAYPFSSYRPLTARHPTALRRGDVHRWFGGIQKFVAAHECRGKEPEDEKRGAKAKAKRRSVPR